MAATTPIRHSVLVPIGSNRSSEDALSRILLDLCTRGNPKDFDVREYAISLAGRLSEKNPAYVLPALRRHLIQLLTYLEQSADSKCREESAKLLGCLIRRY